MRAADAPALLGDVLVTGERRFSIEEVELYLKSEAHPDPFVHAHPAQRVGSRWYFHRVGDGYRGGSFKGLDVTLDEGIGGVLLRTLRRADGSLVSGPSLLVDALLDATGHASVAALDAQVAGRDVNNPGSPLRLEPGPTPDALATARIGLTLKRHTPGDGRPAYLLRRLRWLADVRAIRKGRVHAVIALHQDGLDADAIRARTGSTRAHVDRWLDRYRAGLEGGDLITLAGRDAPLAELHGAWAARFLRP